MWLDVFWDHLKIQVATSLYYEEAKIFVFAKYPFKNVDMCYVIENTADALRMENIWKPFLFQSNVQKQINGVI